MLDLLKIYLVVSIRSFIFYLQRSIRFILNGHCYPTKEQRENGGFRDFWIGWIAYRYFSKVVVCDGWLTVEFPGPYNDFIFVTNTHGDKMTKSFPEIIYSIKANNKINKMG